MTESNSDPVDTEYQMLNEAGDHAPVTAAGITEDLTALGVRPGMLVIVHTSLSKLGWVAGGPQAVINALLALLGEKDTLMMPAHSGQLSDPETWKAPPVPESWWPIIRREMPGFDPEMTPTRKMGAVAELFRHLRGVRRSAHPQVSFAALGPLADTLTARHPLDCLFGDDSPMGQLYEHNGWVLLLGVDHGNNTVIHLAEDRAEFQDKAREKDGAPIFVAGVRRWQQFQPLKVDDGDFAELGDAFAEQTGREFRGPVGWGTGRLMKARDIVDFASAWITENRR